VFFMKRLPRCATYRPHADPFPRDRHARDAEPSASRTFRRAERVIERIVICDDARGAGRRQPVRISVIAMTAADEAPDSHAGGEARFDAVDAVFKDEAARRVDADPFSRIEKDI